MTRTGQPHHVLKALRLQAGLTQDQLAEKTGINRSWMNQMERGNRKITDKPRKKMASVLAAALGREPSEVVVELGGGDPDLPAYRGLHQRLEELETVLAAEQKAIRRAREAVARRLAGIEARLDSLEQAGSPRRRPSTGG